MDHLCHHLRFRHWDLRMLVESAALRASSISKGQGSSQSSSIKLPGHSAGRWRISPYLQSLILWPYIITQGLRRPSQGHMRDSRSSVQRRFLIPPKESKERTDGSNAVQQNGPTVVHIDKQENNSHNSGPAAQMVGEEIHAVGFGP